MEKQAIQNILRLHYAVGTEETNGTIKYAVPVRISDLQKIALSVSSSMDKKYTDMGTDLINSFEGGTLAIDTYGISNEVISITEGHKVDSNGVTVKKSDDEPPILAIGYEMIKRNGFHKFVWLLYCKKKLQGDDGAVKEAKIDPKSTSLNFEISDRADKMWEYNVSEDDENAPTNLKDVWFTQVYDGTIA